MNDDSPKTISVPAAGKRYFNIGKNASYAAAHRGEIPTIKIGRSLRAVVVALERMLDEAGQVVPELRIDPRAERNARPPSYR